MAIKSTNAEEMNKAIVQKVERVLNNIEYGRSLRMTISADLGSIPEIKYQVDEAIVWDQDRCVAEVEEDTHD